MEYSGSEKIENVKKESKEIVHPNTRFRAKPFNLSAEKEKLAKAASNEAQKLQGKIGPDGKEIVPDLTPSMNGYKFVGTPSPMPGKLLSSCHLCIFLYLFYGPIVSMVSLFKCVICMDPLCYL